MLSIQAFSRLHFGVLRLSREAVATEDPICSRWFGGVGLMIEEPRWRLHLASSAAWSAEGPQAVRALSFAQHYQQITRQEAGRGDLPACALRLEEGIAEHAGLGSGTQLALSVARALSVYWGVGDDVPALAHKMGRGQRSGLGVHGFEHGGLLVEGGKSSPDRLAPLVARLPFPPAWRIVLVMPTASQAKEGLHGNAESEAFTRLADQSTPQQTDALCRLVLLGLLPAVVDKDVDAFGEVLYEFNRRVGESFAVVQGGTYASPRVAEIIQFVRNQGVRGVGQSSWGPTVFAVVADADRAEHLALRLRQRFASDEATVRITVACNHGAMFGKKS